jgi:Chaperone of endosialidase
MAENPLGPPPPPPNGIKPAQVTANPLGPPPPPPPLPPSDLRLKHDVRRVGTTVFELPLYHFKYIGNPETYEGVMAQEVLQVMPDAVSVGADGYYRVNYAALGTNMRQVS